MRKRIFAIQKTLLAQIQTLQQTESKYSTLTLQKV